MKSASRIFIEFKQPSHGWLPVEFKSGGFELSFHASRVPVDSIHKLYTAVLSAIEGFDSTVWWHLEPEGYYFQFSREESEYRLKIYFAEDSSKFQQLQHETTGSASDILLPCYRAIKKLTSYNHTEQDWPSLDKKSIARLTEAAKAIKEAT